MKKLACLFLAIWLCFPTLSIKAEEPVELTPSASASFLIDFETGTVLYEKNAEEKHCS